MNCLEARRRILAEPAAARGAAARHLERCAPCTAFADRIQRLDGDLAAALAVSASAALPGRILAGPRGSRRRF
ncbi:MAG TPA: DUF3379 family protein, partial [Myxococcota bacterium]|nr:DUF3379 family protein [Myxococcota bacterium]